MNRDQIALLMACSLTLYNASQCMQAKEKEKAGSPIISSESEASQNRAGLPPKKRNHVLSESGSEEDAVDVSLPMLFFKQMQGEKKDLTGKVRNIADNLKPQALGEILVLALSAMNDARKKRLIAEQEYNELANANGSNVRLYEQLEKECEKLEKAIALLEESLNDGLEAQTSQNAIEESGQDDASNATLAKRLSKANAEIRNLQAQIRGHKGSSTRAKNESAAQIADLTTQVEKLQEKLEHLKGKKQRFRTAPSSPVESMATSAAITPIQTRSVPGAVLPPTPPIVKPVAPVVTSPSVAPVATPPVVKPAATLTSVTPVVTPSVVKPAAAAPVTPASANATPGTAQAKRPADSSGDEGKKKQKVKLDYL